MGSKRFKRKSKADRQRSILSKEIFARKQKISTKESLTEIKNSFPLTESDRLEFIYKKTAKGTVKEIVCVSYDLLIGNEWITVVRYDTHSGVLHRHMRVSIEDVRDGASTTSVKKKGTVHQLLTWAMKDIRKRYIDYRRGFLKRSKKYLKRNEIDMY